MKKSNDSSDLVTVVYSIALSIILFYVLFHFGM